MTSSTESNLNNGAIGPKVSSLATFIDALTPVKTVGL